MVEDTAPILLFCYKRLDVLKSTVAALQQNFLASESDLFIFSDGAKGSSEQTVINEVREFLNTIQGFRSIEIFEAAENKGLAQSIINGVTKVFEKYNRVIVLEDDLVTSTNFLSFMNQALSFYENKNVFSVAGFSFPIKGLPHNSVYFTGRSSSWGWATWKDRWTTIDWEVKDYESFRRDSGQRRRFNKMGSDLSGMLDDQMNGRINSWAIRWCFNQFKQQGYTVHPAISKVVNKGFGNEATHTTEKFDRYKTILDQSGNTEFAFTDKIELDPRIVRQAVKHYSIPFRVYHKVLNVYYKNVASIFQL